MSAAHSINRLAPDTPAELCAADGSLAASLLGQIAYGRPFSGELFSQDYVLWAVAEPVDPRRVLNADVRPLAQPGERVVVFGRDGDGDGGSIRRAGVVMSAAPDAIWIQLDDSFFPGGFSGCPVVSQVTGRVIGMAVAGADRPPVVMGVHPVRSLVEKAQAVLP